MSRRTLVVALYAEGQTDRNFLPGVVRREMDAILGPADPGVDVIVDPSLEEHDRPLPAGADGVLEAARRAVNYDLLVVHADADDNTPDNAIAKRIGPGFELVGRSVEELCKNLVPLVPVHMTEAWMLVDPIALLNVIGTDLSFAELGLPKSARAIERLADPKTALDEALRRAQPGRRRRRKIKRSALYTPLAETVSLERLRALPSFQRFENEMTTALQALGLLRS